MRTSHKRPCKFCGRATDTRGIRMHETTCKENPANHEAEVASNIRQIETDHLNGNLKVFMEIYRQGFRDGLEETKAA